MCWGKQLPEGNAWFCCFFCFFLKIRTRNKEQTNGAEVGLRDENQTSPQNQIPKTKALPRAARLEDLWQPSLFARFSDSATIEAQPTKQGHRHKLLSVFDLWTKQRRQVPSTKLLVSKRLHKRVQRIRDLLLSKYFFFISFLTRGRMNMASLFVRRQRRPHHHHRGMSVVCSFPWSHWLIVSCEAAKPRCVPPLLPKGVLTDFLFCLMTRQRANRDIPHVWEKEGKKNNNNNKKKQYRRHYTSIWPICSIGQIIDGIQCVLTDSSTLHSLWIYETTSMQTGPPGAICSGRCCPCCTWASAGRGRSRCWGGFVVPHNLEETGESCYCSEDPRKQHYRWRTWPQLCKSVSDTTWSELCGRLQV